MIQPLSEIMVAGSTATPFEQDGQYVVQVGGVYPGDNIDSVREREKIIALAKTNPAEYFKKLRSWAVERMEKLKNEGWRKAQNAA